MLPGKADAAMQLHGIGGNDGGHFARVGFREKGSSRGIAASLGPMAHRLIRHGAHRLECHLVVRAAMLQGLERPDGLAELHARLQILDGQRQDRIGQSEPVAGERERGVTEQLIDQARPQRRFAQHAIGGKHQIAQVSVRQMTGAIDEGLGFDRHSVLAGPHQHQVMSAVLGLGREQ